MTRINEHGQPIGDAIEWTPRPLPEHKTIKGRYCTLVKPLPEHTHDLFEAHKGTDADWTYMFSGPFKSEKEFEEFMKDKQMTNDPLHFVVIDNSTGKAVGTLSFLRIDPTMGAVEIGHVTFSNKLKGTFASTEAQFLLMREAISLGYRRLEWKCDSLNAPSRKAAARLGYTYEGTFRQAVIYKGRTRDTAWFSIIDKEWPALEKRFETYLAESNNKDGRHITPLQECS